MESMQKKSKSMITKEIIAFLESTFDFIKPFCFTICFREELVPSYKDSGIYQVFVEPHLAITLSLGKENQLA